MAGNASHDPVRMVVYTRRGCHLCEPAVAIVADLAREAGVGWVEVDVDSGPYAPALVARWGEMVPVVTVDDVEVGHWRIDVDRLRRVLGLHTR